MRKLGLTRSQWLLLTNLYFCDGTTQKELADLMGLGESSLGKLTQKLQVGGWLERQPHARDGRAFHLCISEQKRPIVAKLVTMLIMETERSLVGFSAEERANLMNYMDRIQANIASVPPAKKWLKLKTEVLDEVAHPKR
jgi:DNA-binding MarR family transcriptional regulator